MTSLVLALVGGTATAALFFGTIWKVCALAKLVAGETRSRAAWEVSYNKEQEARLDLENALDKKNDELQRESLAREKLQADLDDLLATCGGDLSDSINRKLRELSEAFTRTAPKDR